MPSIRYLIFILGLGAALTFIASTAMNDAQKQTMVLSAPAQDRAPDLPVLKKAPEVSSQSPVGAHPHHAQTHQRSLTRVENLYAEILALKQRKTSGSYAQASTLIDLCRAAVSASSGYKFLLKLPANQFKNTALPETPAVAARQVSAMQTIEARCRDIVASPDISQPFPDDHHGIEYQKAMAVLSASDDLRKLKAALQEISQQGQLSSAYKYIAGVGGNPVFFRGELLYGDELKEFQMAVGIAIMSGADSSGTGVEDIRFLTLCLQNSDCPGAVQSVFLRESNETKRARILSLARAIQQAWDSGDFNIFLPQIHE